MLEPKPQGESENMLAVARRFVEKYRQDLKTEYPQEFADAPSEDEIRAWREKKRSGGFFHLSPSPPKGWIRDFLTKGACGVYIDIGGDSPEAFRETVAAVYRQLQYCDMTVQISYGPVTYETRAWPACVKSLTGQESCDILPSDKTYDEFCAFIERETRWAEGVRTRRAGGGPEMRQ